jgi:hypothetical protein
MHAKDVQCTCNMQALGDEAKPSLMIDLETNETRTSTSSHAFQCPVTLLLVSGVRMT